MAAPVVEHSYKDQYQALHNWYLREFEGGIGYVADGEDEEDTNATDEPPAAILEICQYVDAWKSILLPENGPKREGKVSFIFEKIRTIADFLD